ncbi:MAG: hypothetical protein KUG67_01705 [Proteobacteria bacterium]|nr:hypothetical protein [Pseudomonadota bacterium]
MNPRTEQLDSIKAVEAIILKHFRKEPFQNLHLLYGSDLQLITSGGTCSDKTLAFLADAQKAGFDARLHSGFIGGREIHRLARIHIGKRIFFADIGNGWPSIKLYPTDKEICFHSYGMRYRTEIHSSRLLVFHKKQERETLQLEIELRGKAEKQILADIENRFTSGILYPFASSPRFSMVVGERFLFLRGTRLEIHSVDNFDVIEGIEGAEIPSILNRYFGYNVGSLFQSTNNSV